MRMPKGFLLILCLVLVLLAGCAPTVFQGTVTSITHTRENVTYGADKIVVVITFDNSLQVRQVITDYYNDVYKTGKRFEVGKEYFVRYSPTDYKIPNYLLDFWEIK